MAALQQVSSEQMLYEEYDLIVESVDDQQKM